MEQIPRLAYKTGSWKPNHTGYDVTDYFRFTVIGVQKTVENDASDDFRWNFMRKV